MPVFPFITLALQVSSHGLFHDANGTCCCAVLSLQGSYLISAVLMNGSVVAAISLLIFVCDQTLGRFLPRQRLTWANDPLLAYRLHKSRAWIRGKGG